MHGHTNVKLVIFCPIKTDDMRRSNFYRSYRNNREPLVTARVWSNPTEDVFVKSRLLGTTLIKPLLYSCPWYCTHFIPEF